MNENINLCELLKGHEGETFYSPICGNTVLKKIDISKLHPIELEDMTFGSDGKWSKYGDCLLFPSKDQQDWDKWAKEQKPKVPKTWSDYRKIDEYNWDSIIENSPTDKSSIAKSALALLKIHQLIEVGYGGNITNEEWESDNIKYVIKYFDKRLAVDIFRYNMHHIAFRTKEQAEEFMSYEENVQLLKDYYML